MKKKFTPITFKVNLIVTIALILGIGGASVSLGYVFLLGIEQKTRQNLVVQSDILFKAIEKYMLPGQANYAVEFFRDIATVNPEYGIRLYRTSGEKAFTDDLTIESVNRKIGVERFFRDAKLADDPATPDPGRFASAIGRPPEDVFFVTAVSGKTFYHIYKPLINLPKCTGCHGSDHTVRGVIDITNDITRDLSEQRTRFGIIVGIMMLVGVTFLAVVITQFLRRTVIAPVRAIGEVCAKVTSGVFSERVVIRSNDEIGSLGETVNAMALGLHERYELSKFVSAETLKSLTAKEKGQKARFTILFSDIRGFTAYSEKLGPEKVVSNLNRVLNAQTEIIRRHGGDVDKYVGDEIVAIFSGGDAVLSACRAANEIQAEIETRSRALYDGLRVGIGINTGDVILGMIGSETRADFTVIGDNVNIASRLCNSAQAGQVLIHDNVHSLAGGAIGVQGPYRLKVKGKDDFLRVYLLVSVKQGGGHS